ncbi:MAG: 2-oxoglutarate dehydrogenase E1 component, partial [Eudoraea sp.]|nr:2-oxoglutarate dehydrogenase E1 component [Eudoraea sp.]
FVNGTFQKVIDDIAADPKKVKSLVFCTGKFYYDLLAVKEETGREDVALVRLELLFPLPVEDIRNLMKKYNKADDLVWAQEEPRNMGAWTHFFTHLEEARDFRVASRRFYASPAAGSAVRSRMRHQQVIDYVFDKTKDNMTRRVTQSEYKKK